MNRMIKNIILLAGGVVLALSAMSCDEFPPVKYDDPEPYKVYTDADFPGVTFTSVADLKAMYEGEPVEIRRDVYIKAQVNSSDQSGNLYRTMYVQDATGGIEVKMGTRNLYNEYKFGQWVYINCNGLSVGDYNGMVGLGYKSADPKYETAYIDSQYIIDTHIFRGEPGKLEPILIDEAGITAKDNYGRYVTVSGLTYGNQIFAILYKDPNAEHEGDNRWFLSYDPSYDGPVNTYGNFGIDTWAISETGFQKLLDDPDFDFNGAIPCEDIQSKSEFVAPYSYSVSQYFKKGSTDLQVRSSGYARFADTRIAQEILDGATVNLTGILTYYNSGSGANYQMILNDLNGVEIVGSDDAGE